MGASAASHALFLVLAVPLVAGDAAAQEQAQSVHARRTSVFFGPHVGYELSTRVTFDRTRSDSVGGGEQVAYPAHADVVGAEMGVRFSEHYAVLARYEHAFFGQLGGPISPGADLSSNLGELGFAYFSHPDGHGWYGEVAFGARFFDSSAWEFKGEPLAKGSPYGGQLALSFGPNLRVSWLNLTPIFRVGVATVLHREWDTFPASVVGPTSIMPPPSAPTYGFLELGFSAHVDLGLR